MKLGAFCWTKNYGMSGSENAKWMNLPKLGKAGVSYFDYQWLLS